jgi:hypothetical protein
LPIKHFFAGVPVPDLGPVLAWYERLLGRPADSAPSENEAVWHVTDGASIYVVADADRAGNALLTLIVDGLEDRVGELARRGLVTGAIETVPGLYRRP